jgi:hypothetical protein
MWYKEALGIQNDYSSFKFALHLWNKYAGKLKKIA